MSKTTKSETAPKAKVIYLGIDAHLDKYVVVRQVDGLSPQPAQTFRSENSLLQWVAKQQKAAHDVVACYEAGPLGFVLYRQLHAMGVTCHVVAAKRWSENEDRVKTDKRDARILCQRVESYHRGNHTVLNVLRVPTEEEERRRALGRQREAFKKELQSNAQRGRGQALLWAVRLKGQWWKGNLWESTQKQEPELLALLIPLREIILTIETQLKTLTRQLEEESIAENLRPKGLGALTWRMVQGEVCDFTRFNNRGQVASYTGLCPSESSSGGSRRLGSVNKHGNRLLRNYLVEATWRLIRWQPDWYAWKKWQAEYQQASGGRRKQIVVALARILAVDLWRIATKQTTLENLGLQPANPA
ncbi:IS110 family transposase [Roseibacillus persicicus]|nr:IS110 family transposase [Roseibacillus persicicus]